MQERPHELPNPRFFSHSPVLDPVQSQLKTKLCKKRRRGRRRKGGGEESKREEKEKDGEILR